MKTCSECTRTSQNKYFDCPPRMADGRHFTDYRPKCLTNTTFQSDQPMTSFEYRKYLISNASKLVQQDRARAYNQNMCGPCVEPFDQGTMLPEQTMTVCDANVCKFYMNDENGLGLGRVYSTTADSSAKQAFLKNKSNEQTHLKQKSNCCVSSDTDDYYPVGALGDNYVGRYATPSGALPFEANDMFA